MVLAAGVVMAAAGVSMVWCVLVLALTPWVTVVGYEAVGHRHNERVLADSRADRHGAADRSGSSSATTTSVLGASALDRGRSVVDAGRGTGVGPTVAAANPPQPGAVIGVDYIAASVEHRRSLGSLMAANLSFVTADAATSGRSAPIDVAQQRP